MEDPQQPRETSVAAQAPAYTAEGSLFGVPITVYVLPDGQRVVNADRFFAVLVSIGLADDAAHEMLAFGRWLRSLPGQVRE